LNCEQKFEYQDIAKDSIVNDTNASGQLIKPNKPEQGGVSQNHA
jgi:hypothetical protein